MLISVVLAHLCGSNKIFNPALTRLEPVSSICTDEGCGLNIGMFKATRMTKVAGTVDIQSSWWQKHMLCLDHWLYGKDTQPSKHNIFKMFPAFSHIHPSARFLEQTLKKNIPIRDRPLDEGFSSSDVFREWPLCVCLILDLLLCMQMVGCVCVCLGCWVQGLHVGNTALCNWITERKIRKRSGLGWTCILFCVRTFFQFCFFSTCDKGKLPCSLLPKTAGKKKQPQG